MRVRIQTDHCLSRLCEECNGEAAEDRRKPISNYFKYDTRLPRHNYAVPRNDTDSPKKGGEVNPPPLRVTKETKRSPTLHLNNPQVEVSFDGCIIN